MKLLITFFVLFFYIKCIGQDTVNCRCKYYSSYSMRDYKFKVDSINKKLNKKYGRVMMVGFRGFSAAKFLFIVNSKGQRKGFSYDLIDKKYNIIVGKKVDELAKKIEKVKFTLNKVNEIPSEYISHDVSYFVSFDVSSGIQEVCGSQILTVKDKDIGKLFSYYMNEF